MFTVSAEDLVTKATIADGTNVNALHWEIYLTDNVESAAKPLGKGVELDGDGDKNFVVDLSLVADQKYTIIFWAQVSDLSKRQDGLNDFYAVDDLRKVKIDYHENDVHVDDEDRAAFFAKHKFNTQNGPVSETVKLYRPFSQINLGATNLNTSLNNVNGGIVVVNSTEITVKNVATVFNTLHGMGDVELKSLTYKRERTPYYDYKARHLEVNKNYYHWLSMNYIAVLGDADNVTLDIKVNTTVGTVSHAISNVPVKENHRTNILGDLLTTSSKFEVVVDEHFLKPDLGAYDILKNVLAEGGEFTLLDDMTFDEFIEVADDKAVTLNLNGHTISGVGIISYGNLTINGPGMVNATDCAVWARGDYDAAVTINGGHFVTEPESGSCETIYASGNGKIRINGGKFENKVLDEKNFTDPCYPVLNLHGNGATGCDIEAYGGEYVNFNPADNVSENPKKNFVADGYESVETSQGSNVWVVRPVKK